MILSYSQPLPVFVSSLWWLAIYTSINISFFYISGILVHGAITISSTSKQWERWALFLWHILPPFMPNLHNALVLLGIWVSPLSFPGILGWQWLQQSSSIDRASDCQSESHGFDPWLWQFDSLCQKTAFYLRFKWRSGLLLAKNGLVLVTTSKNIVWMTGHHCINEVYCWKLKPQKKLNGQLYRACQNANWLCAGGDLSLICCQGFKSGANVLDVRWQNTGDTSAFLTHICACN